jgi:hypothetical protein
MPFRRFPIIALVSMLMGWVLSTGCIFSPDEEPPPPQVPPEIVPRTSPENVLKNLQAIYNDKVRSAIERREFYEQLLPPDPPAVPPDEAFLFFFQPVDIAAGLPPSWPKDQEIAAHDAIFRAQESGDIYSLELRITHNDAEPLNPQQPGREDWQEIFATNVYLRLMFNLEDGLEVNGGQAEFRFAAPVDSLYVINEWTDLPRPGI